MEQIRLIMSCAKCKQEFLIEKECNTKEQAQKYKAWAEENVSLCPDCYLAMMEVSDKVKHSSAGGGKAIASVDLECIGCGDTFTHEKICPNEEKAGRYEEWAYQHIVLCPNCYRSLHMSVEARKGNELLEAIHAPDLEGTPKQVAWAEDIRRKYALEFALQKPDSEFWDAFCKITSAKWWIDNKGAISLRILARKIINLSNAW